MHIYWEGKLSFDVQNEVEDLYQFDFNDTKTIFPYVMLVWASHM